MRMIRALTIATAVVMALPNLAAAQVGRQFKDAWFWGIKGGGLTFADSGGKYREAGFAGIDWLITRTHGGLYVSGGEAFLRARTLSVKDPTSVDSGFRVLDLRDVRKLDVALMGFPGENLKFHPYVGAGFTLNELVDAQPLGVFSNADQVAFTAQIIQDQKVSFSPFFIAGAQWRLSSISIFGQGSVNPAEKNFILYNGRPFNFTFELGMRYNVGSSIDRQ
jgi:hypothetical protein